ncbi:TetR/AcrR family transcriptional regulator [Novosphingobium kaempferiae]|uniref:TetR/AcrR family transcriptional regulator n=1 Tax=Novosphingobium kaempferiae TaxID=2896849 RepID=UPI001E3E9185|nr:TetR/AcrR family transcriptional regulator [Novosphingobium kaempferiae]
MAEDSRSTVRTPRQGRALHKIELILEAAIRLVDSGGMGALTTNAVAQTAGVSIGTLYQYFPNKEAILDALADREMAELSQRVIAALSDASMHDAGEKVSRIVRAVTCGYGERRQAHRLVAEYSLSRGGGRLTPLIERVIALLTAGDAEAEQAGFGATEAFVLTNAFAGVLRAMILGHEDGEPSQADIEAALKRLVMGFVQTLPGD